MSHKTYVWEGIAAIMAVSLMLGTVLALAPIAGFRAQVILSDSMAPTLHTGSLVVVHMSSPWLYKQGDVVSFIPPIAGGSSVTHRIVRLYQSGGVPVMQTKGDGNSKPDQWITGTGSILGREVLSVPYVGYLIQLIKTPIGFIVTAILTFGLIVLKEICTLVRTVYNLYLSSRHAATS